MQGNELRRAFISFHSLEASRKLGPGCVLAAREVVGDNSASHHCCITSHLTSLELQRARGLTWTHRLIGPASLSMSSVRTWNLRETGICLTYCPLAVYMFTSVFEPTFCPFRWSLASIPLMSRLVWQMCSRWGCAIWTQSAKIVRYISAHRVYVATLKHPWLMYIFLSVTWCRLLQRRSQHMAKWLNSMRLWKSRGANYPPFSRHLLQWKPNTPSITFVSVLTCKSARSWRCYLFAYIAIFLIICHWLVWCTNGFFMKSIGTSMLICS